MQFVLVIYHGNFPLPGSAAWNALPEAEQKSIYADYAELNKTEGITMRLPTIAPGKATTVEVRDGKTQSRLGPYLAGRHRRRVRVRGGKCGGGGRAGRTDSAGSVGRRSRDPPRRGVLLIEEPPAHLA